MFQPGLRLYPADVRWCVQPGETPLFGRERGCEEFEQEVLRFDGPAAARTSPDDEVLYVLAGSGTGEIEGGRAELTRGSAAYVGSGTTIRTSVPAGALAVSAGKQRNIENWVAEKKKKPSGK